MAVLVPVSNTYVEQVKSTSQAYIDGSGLGSGVTFRVVTLVDVIFFVLTAWITYIVLCTQML